MKSALLLALLLFVGCGVEVPPEKAEQEAGPPYVYAPRAYWAEVGQLHRCWHRALCGSSVVSGWEMGHAQCQPDVAAAETYGRAECGPLSSGCSCEVRCWRTGDADGICCNRGPPGDGRAGWVGSVCRD